MLESSCGSHEIFNQRFKSTQHSANSSVVMIIRYPPGLLVSDYMRVPDLSLRISFSLVRSAHLRDAEAVFVCYCFRIEFPIIAIWSSLFGTMCNGDDQSFLDDYLMPFL